MASRFCWLPLFLLFNLAAIHVFADVLFEEGYTVTTVLDGDKLKINPYSILPRPGSSDFIILDSSGNTVYTVSFPISEESVIKRLAGNGTEGFSDGDSGSVMFSKPKSFAVDLKGNVYVADQKKSVIRKISNSGVTTIAGHYEARGHVDGPGQNATFSADFELVFIPERCALMISDHGNRLVRQVNLKQEDCIRGSQSVLGVASAWILGLGVSCILGLIIGIVIHPYIITHVSISLTHVIVSGRTGLLTHCLTKFCRQEGPNLLPFSRTWNHFLTSQGRQVLMFYFDIRSAVVNSTSYTLLRRLILLSLSHLSVKFRVNLVETQTGHVKSVSLLDSDDLSSSKETTKSQADQLEDLITFDGGQELSGTTEDSNVLSDSCQSIDKMIQAHLMGFAEQAEKTSQGKDLVSRSGLVKRR